MDTVLPELSEFTVEGSFLPTPDGKSAPLVMGAGDDSYRWCYWRKPDGWIVFGPAWAEEFKNNIIMGWRPLLEYGYFWLRNSYADGTTWNVNTEPWRQIFLLGGAKEFSIEEIGTYGWHRKPPYKGVSFPQLKEGMITDFACPQCNRKFIAKEHLVRHETIAHKETSTNNAFARSIADAMAKAQGEFSGPLGQMMLLMQQQIAQQGKLLEALTERVVGQTVAQAESEEEPPPLPNVDPTTIRNAEAPVEKVGVPDLGLTDDRSGRRIKRITQA